MLSECQVFEIHQRSKTHSRRRLAALLAGLEEKPQEAYRAWGFSRLGDKV